MPRAGLLKFLHLSYLSKPASDRVVYREIRQGNIRSILEFGVNNALRTRRMLELAARYHEPAELRYTGVDLFEMRSADHPGITLKLAHKKLKPLAGRVQLAPGDPLTATARLANSLANTDLIVIAADQDAEALDRAWSYFPRMMHDRTIVLREIVDAAGRKTRMVPIDRVEIERLARRVHSPRSRAA